MKRLELTEEWTENILKKEKTAVKDVFLMTVDNDRNYSLVLDYNYRDAAGQTSYDAAFYFQPGHYNVLRILS